MKFPPKPVNEYEKVKTEEWVSGVIQDIQYEDRLFKGADGVKPAVRFKMTLVGCEYPHYSRWMSFGCSEKSKLYISFIQPLVDGAKPYMDFDLDVLKGAKIKTMWSNNGEYQNLDMVRPQEEKIDPNQVPF